MYSDTSGSGRPSSTGSPTRCRSTSAASSPASAPAPASNLKAHLDIDEPDEIADRVQQLAVPHPLILERLHVDSRYLYLRASRDWQDVELTEDTYRDEFGIVRQAAIRPDGHLLYYDFIGHPLSEGRRWGDLARYPLARPARSRPLRWPRGKLARRSEGLRQRARREHDRLALRVQLVPARLRRFFQDLMLNPELAKALLDAMSSTSRPWSGKCWTGLARTPVHQDRLGPGHAAGTDDQPGGLLRHHLAALPKTLGSHPQSDPGQDLLPLLRQYVPIIPILSRVGLKPSIPSSRWLRHG